MGTVFSIDIRDPGDWSTAIAELVSWLHHVDDTFTTYQADSPISRLSRGELTLADCSPEVVGVLVECDALAAETGGYFSARAAGRLDPSGYVKGWAIERGSQLLRDHGSGNHAINGGGDIQCAGERAPQQPWRVGIPHPLLAGRLAAVVAIADGAVATSGNSERGAHVIDPTTGRPATELASVTIAGGRLSRVDAYPTAALAMGKGCRTWLTGLEGTESLILTATGERWETAGFAALKAQQ
jgi:FAD:protein FMN transferase